MAAYSFLDVQAAITGPGLSVSLGGSNGVAKEGITVAMTADKNTMTIGADGGGMHSLHGDNSGVVTIRLLKTNPFNHVLSAAYNYQKTSAAYWGQNAIVVSNPTRGDVATALQCAFKKQPDFVNAEEGGIVEWAFDSVHVSEILGDGTPNAA